MPHAISRRLSCFLVLALSLASPLLAQDIAGRWISRTPLPTPRQEMPHAVIDGKIYVVGGLDMTRGATNQMEVYDPVSGLWSAAAPLPTAMHHLGLAAANGKLYVVGGYVGNSFNPSNRVFEYDPSLDAWTEKTRMPLSRGAHIAVTVEGKIYAIGGVAFGTPVGTTQRYDPASDTWTDLEPMPTPREHLAAAALDGLIYVIGGRTPLGNLRTLEAYDPDTDTWALLQGMPTARGGLAAAGLNGMLYVFGGEFPGVFAQNEAYDPTTDKWEAAAPMPSPRHGIGAVAVADTIFIIGGGPRAGFGVTDVNSGFIPPNTTPTSRHDAGTLPERFALYQNHPNPFSTTTTIRFELAHPAEVTLTIYDLLGRVVAMPLQGPKPAGQHTLTWAATDQPGGLYLYRLSADGVTAAKTLIVVR